MRKSTFIFVVGLILFSCKKEEVSPEPVENSGSSNGGGSTSEYFISFKLDGVDYTFTNGVDGFGASTSNGGSIDSQNSIRTVDLGAGVVDLSDFNVNAHVTFNNHVFAFSDYYGKESEAIEKMCKLGSREFWKDDGSQQTGVDFQYVADGQNDVVWSSIGEQDGVTSFNVTKSTGKTNAVGDAQQEVEGDFSCKLFYDGDSKVLTNGKFKLLFEAP